MNGSKWGSEQAHEWERWKSLLLFLPLTGRRKASDGLARGESESREWAMTVKNRATRVKDRTEKRERGTRARDTAKERRRSRNRMSRKPAEPAWECERVRVNNWKSERESRRENKLERSRVHAIQSAWNVYIAIDHRLPNNAPLKTNSTAIITKVLSIKYG